MPITGQISFAQFANMGDIYYGDQQIGAVYYGSQLIWKHVIDVDEFDIGGEGNDIPAIRCRTSGGNLMSLVVYVPNNQVKAPSYGIIGKIESGGIKTIASLGAGNLTYAGTEVTSKYATVDGNPVYAVKLNAADQLNGIPIEAGEYVVVVSAHGENEYAYNKIAMNDGEENAFCYRVVDYGLTNQIDAYWTVDPVSLDQSTVISFNYKRYDVDPIIDANMEFKLDGETESIVVKLTDADGADITNLATRFEYTIDGVSYTSTSNKLTYENLDFSVAGVYHDVTVVAHSLKGNKSSVGEYSFTVLYEFDNFSYDGIEHALTWDIRAGGADAALSVATYNWSAGEYSGVVHSSMIDTTEMATGSYVFTIGGVTNRNNKLPTIQTQQIDVGVDTHVYTSHSVPEDQRNLGCAVFIPTQDVVLESYTFLSTNPEEWNNARMIWRVDGTGSSPSNYVDIGASFAATNIANTGLLTTDNEIVYKHVEAMNNSVVLEAGKKYLLALPSTQNTWGMDASKLVSRDVGGMTTMTVNSYYLPQNGIVEYNAYVTLKTHVK